MSDHVKRMLEHMKVETEALLLHPRRARLLDHHGNRGSEAEHGILHWLRARFAPEYAVSSGEIIDGYDTDPSPRTKSRQQDGILHRNDPHARRFMLSSELRLIPVESVAAIVEVKLSLNKREFQKADRAASRTAKLRYALQYGSSHPRGSYTSVNVTDEENAAGIPMASVPVMMPTFAVFGYGGAKSPEQLAEWLAEASTVNMICCLGVGFAARSHSQPANQARLTLIAQKEHALASFSEHVGGALVNHANWSRYARVDAAKYARAEMHPYWDETGYEWHPHYTPSPDDIARRQRLYEARPKVVGKKPIAAMPRASGAKSDPRATTKRTRSGSSGASAGAGSSPAGSTPAGR